MKAIGQDFSWLTERPYAHRGLWHAQKGIAENSLSAFRQAIKHGFGIEMDVRLSADGQAIVIHDENLDRLTGRQGNVSETPTYQLNTFNLLGTKDRVESLASVLSVIRGQVPVLIEIKELEGYGDRLAIAVRRALEGYPGRVAIMSFDPAVPAWFAKVAPQVCRGLVTTDKDAKTTWYNRLPFRHELDYRRAKAQFAAHDLGSFPSRFIANLRRRNVPTLSWTVRTEADDLLARANVDNVIFELVQNQQRSEDTETSSAGRAHTANA